MSTTDKVEVYHRPDWHPELSSIYGDIIGAEGYVTEVGTIKILGKIFEHPDIPKSKTETEIRGATRVLTAESALGFM